MSIDVCSLPALLFLVLLTVAFHLCPARGGRRGLLAAANAVVLLALVPNRRGVAGLVFFIAASYAVLRLLKARPSRLRLIAAVCASVVAFVYVKRYTFLHGLLPLALWPEGWVGDMEVIGLSYMLFKYIHMAVDQAQDQLSPYTFLGYAGYQLSFFTLVAGPIQRYNDFHVFWRDMGLGSGNASDASDPSDVGDPVRDTLRAWSRILTGMLKMGVLSSVAFHLFADAGAALDARAARSDPGLLGHFAAYYYAYPFYLYFNFSGYTDIMIGAAGLLGHTLPENFNHPFLARNVIDYWNRWHVSLTHWIRDYVFMAWFKKAAERFPRRSRPWGYFLLFFSLFLAGVWHGATSGFVAFGLLHGLGAAVNRMYGDWLKGRLGRAGLQRYDSNPLVRTAAVLLTFHFAAFCFLFFSSGVEPALRILRLAAGRVFTTGGAPLRGIAPPPVAFAATAALALLAALWKGDALAATLDRWAGWRASGVHSLYPLVIAKTVVVVVVFLALWALQSRGPVVEYMRF